VSFSIPLPDPEKLWLSGDLTVLSSPRKQSVLSRNNKIKNNVFKVPRAFRLIDYPLIDMCMFLLLAILTVSSLQSTIDTFCK
jgi:hypothetical protein